MSQSTQSAKPSHSSHFETSLAQLIQIAMTAPLPEVAQLISGLRTQQLILEGIAKVRMEAGAGADGVGDSDGGAVIGAAGLAGNVIPIAAASAAAPAPVPAPNSNAYQNAAVVPQRRGPGRPKVQKGVEGMEAAAAGRQDVTTVSQAATVPQAPVPQTSVPVQMPQPVVMQPAVVVQPPAATAPPPPQPLPPTAAPLNVPYFPGVGAPTQAPVPVAPPAQFVSPSMSPSGMPMDPPPPLAPPPQPSVPQAPQVPQVPQFPTAGTTPSGFPPGFPPMPSAS